jgi:lysozyme family protein
MSNFPTWWSFCMLPSNDGVAADGPMTRWGWTYQTWCASEGTAESASALALFNTLTEAQAGSLAQTHFWNRLGGTYLNSGPDVSFIDWCWTSGGATRYVQGALSCYPDGIVGPRTIAAMNAVSPGELVQNIHDWRCAYYDSLGFRSQYPGLYTRADTALTLSLGLVK